VVSTKKNRDLIHDLLHNTQAQEKACTHDHCFAPVETSPVLH